ncbi:I78 family peptidase inhibitor [Fodinicurvata fenggangensis]|uniref:I78 family peptidase inhibitor n=1 Tax=Fodinicurvata fenggangensis TaxID=1121830 RepID=UPI00047A08F1|nr:I78 family peptidase inhibitor [Fodinicurvata fenggangensis]
MRSFLGPTSTGGTSRSRRRFLDGLLSQVPVVLGGAFLAGCARTSGAAGAREEGEGGPSEACVSGLEGLHLRAVQEGQPVTQDYRRDRLTLVLDEQGRISRSYIG